MRRKIFTKLAMIATMLSSLSLTAYATEDPVSYVYYTVSGTTATMHTDGSQTSYTVVTDQTSWDDGGWYVVNSDVTIADRITVSGTVNLILCDGKTLTASKGITVNSENTLNIYAQSEGEGSGALIATGNTRAAGIGGISGGNGGTVNIHGGTVNATGGNCENVASSAFDSGAGIGGGMSGNGGTVTIYGGTVIATSGNGMSAGIGGGGSSSGGSSGGSGGSVTIHGGIVTATGNRRGAGIGGGNYGNGGTVTIYGGTVNANGGNMNGAGIGGGESGNGGTVTINGGTVYAVGGGTAMGIGCIFLENPDFPMPWDPTPGDLTLGTGVTMEVSSNNSTWTNYNGSTRTRYMKSSAASHAHDFAYEKTAENVITATCSATDDCPLADNGYKATLTIGMPTTSDGKAVLTQDPADAFGALSGEVQYQSKTGGSWDEATSTPRTSDGVHKASFTIDGKTISVTYGMNCISYATDIANGSIAGPSGATVGAAVMPTITPERGYELATLTVTPEEGSGVAAVALTEDGNGFIMPEANIAVSASFKKADYAIAVATIAHGSVTVKKGETAVTSANYQDNITLTITPDEGYELTTLTVVDAANAAVTVTNGAFVMPDAAVSINATFTAVEYTVGVAQTSNGTLTASKATATIGNEIALTVTPADGYQLTSLTVTKENGGTVNVADGKFNMPADNVTISATFSAIVYTVTVSGAVATVTDNTPAQNTYTVTLNATDKDYDGEPTVATVTKSAGFPSAKVAIGSVTYKSSDGKTVAEAENSGSYTASVAVGDKVISKTFEIRRPETIYYNFVVNQNGRSQKKVAVITQYILLKNNPNGIMVLDDGKIYVAKGNVTIGALIIRGDVLVIPCEGSNLRVRAGIYHIGSSLSIYAEDGADDAVVDVTGEAAFSSLDANEKLEGVTVAGLGSTMSGDVRIYSGNLTMSKGVNAKLVDDDLKFTVGVGVNPIVTTEAGSASLTGGTTSEEGFVSYTSAEFAKVLSLQTELTAVIGAAPTANTGLIYDGEPVELITEGEAIGGTMQYAFGNDTVTAPAEGWSNSVPEVTEAKTYYVWYMVKGDENHKDSEAGCVTATVVVSANQAAADAVVALIDAIPAQVAVTDEAAIVAARTAYDALTDAQKAKVPAEKLKKLTDAEAALAAAKQAAADQAAADAVVALIDSLPAEVAVTDEAAIVAARTAYDALTDAQKALVPAEKLAKLTDAEAALAVAKQAAADQAAADAVVALIDAIPAQVAVTDEAAIVAARAAYDALTEAQKAKVSAEKLTKLTDAEAALAVAKQAAADQAAADAVVALIDALPTEIAVTDEAAIVAARAAYDALTEAQKALVPAEKLKKLTDAEAALAAAKQAAADQAAADAVVALIDAIPAEVTVAAEPAIAAARTAYDALTEAQKAKVPAEKLKKLTDAEAALAAAKQAAADQAAADAVVALIDSLPAEVAVTDEAAIVAARAAYDALTEAQKAKVSAEKLTKLTDAEAALAVAKQAAADQAAADAVVALIDAIPAEVTVAAEPAIAAARTAYDALTEAQKAKVPAEKLAKLTDAEAAGATKEPTGIDETAADAVESNIWYDLNGRRLNGKPTKTGIYINNHKKVYVK